MQEKKQINIGPNRKKLTIRRLYLKLTLHPYIRFINSLATLWTIDAELVLAVELFFQHI